jgi:hypothetical protein
MPRRNENGFHTNHERHLREWGYRDPASWNPLLSKSFTKSFTPNSLRARGPHGPEAELRTPNSLNLTPNSELRAPNYSTIKTTGEGIVRDNRRQKAEGRRQEEKATPTFQPYRVIPQRHPSIIRKIIGRINWGMVSDLVCIAALGIAISVIFSLIVFGPFSMRELWK